MIKLLITIKQLFFFNYSFACVNKDVYPIHKPPQKQILPAACGVLSPLPLVLAVGLLSLQTTAASSYNTLHSTAVHSTQQVLLLYTLYTAATAGARTMHIIHTAYIE